MEYPPTQESTTADASRYLHDVFPGGLNKGEVFWRDHQPWLENRGYMLRPRYHPGGLLRGSIRKNLDLNLKDKLIDARRISDGAVVLLKKVDVGQTEVIMGPLFSSDPLASDPKNHCIPIYETIPLPNTDKEVIFVMPHLTLWQLPDFDTVGEVVDFCRQVFEARAGLQFMHEQWIAHNDVKLDNIMMDSSPLYSRLPHPINQFSTYDFKKQLYPRGRTRHPVKYYFIDFDLCEQYDITSGPPRKKPIYGGDTSVPEFRNNPEQPCDPFAVDVYRIGDLIRTCIAECSPAGMPRNIFLSQFGGAPIREPFSPALAFMEPLIDDMIQEDPEKRPTMDQVVLRFDNIVEGLSQWKLRSPTWPYKTFRGRFVRRPLHWCRQIYYMAMRVPAVPTPK
ncbi:hypothetical protein WG66_008496 [Moniliophthora roreri]|nr:hypothetical protein WG66_008496 [Moniliophthora roreri]